MIDALLATGLLPDPVVRHGIRRLLRQRLRQEEEAERAASRSERLRRWADEMRRSPLALHAEDAKAQHYEVPTEFFRLVLGHRLKYSSGYWPAGVTTLDGAEDAMLELTADRADLHDGQRVLDLGCGWGALSLWLAARHPASQVLAVSHSATQRTFIEAQARRRGLSNLRVVTAGMESFAPAEVFDRVVSVEMFEHLRNWEEMLARIASWLAPNGQVFVHVFTHARHAYPFLDEGAGDWMARHFFTGGQMPSEDLLPQFQQHLAVTEQWRVEGTHYARSARAWLENMDRHEDLIAPLFRATYGTEARRFRSYWRTFFMACEELWAWEDGREWTVSHYQLESRSPQA